MSNASLKEQLQAVASQLSDKSGKEQKPKKHFHQIDRDKERVKKPKPKWLDYVQYGVELLRVYFPAGFKTHSEIKPLKKGIKQDLVKRLSTLDSIVTEDKACMVKSLAYYVNTAAYHKSVVEGATRIDLDGNPAGLVTAEEARYSIEKQQAKLLAKQTAKPVTQMPQVTEELA
ncbi:RNA chaperone ProQ [Aquicella siphonis]|uniref:RNA chaperone ProQ n=1 Tax=Aquicella siphonis TaxID=254247 RepID=A0A5E4PL37_9COXI|nr:ProQ/FinO family protein [Aquicella siphonis]VVC76972.1 RNA chaperone ProQ [Aquicella siphonis]